MNDLSNETILYRAIRNKRWIEPRTKEIDGEAFLLRPNETFLSAAITSSYSYKNLTKCYGVISFTVGDVRELGLDAIQDKGDHVSITGLLNPDTNEKEASDIAGKLASKAKLFLDRLDNPLKK